LVVALGAGAAAAEGELGPEQRQGHDEYPRRPACPGRARARTPPPGDRREVASGPATEASTRSLNGPPQVLRRNPRRAYSGKSDRSQWPRWHLRALGPVVTASQGALRDRRAGKTFFRRPPRPARPSAPAA